MGGKRTLTISPQVVIFSEVQCRLPGVARRIPRQSRITIARSCLGRAEILLSDLFLRRGDHRSLRSTDVYHFVEMFDIGGSSAAHLLGCPGRRTQSVGSRGFASALHAAAAASAAACEASAAAAPAGFFERQDELTFVFLSTLSLAWDAVPDISANVAMRIV